MTKIKACITMMSRRILPKVIIQYDVLVEARRTDFAFDNILEKEVKIMSRFLVL